MLYVINIGFERVNAKFFRILDKNALSHLEVSHMLGFTWWRLLAVRVDFFIFAFYLLLHLCFCFCFFFFFSPFHLVPNLKNPKVLLKYWPKLCRKKEPSKPQKPVTVLKTVRFDHSSHGSLLFSHRTVLETKKLQNWEVRGFLGWTIRSSPSFKTLSQTT